MSALARHPVPLRLFDTFPTGVTPTAAAGASWSCTVITQTATCTRSDALAPNALYSDVTLAVHIANNAPLSFTNTATVSGGSETNFANNTASNSVTIGAGPDLAITLTASSGAAQGQAASFTIGSSNVGGAITSGPVTITDTFPVGITPSAPSGTGWSCTVAGQTITCNRPDALPPGGNYPPITASLNIASNAPATLPDTATISNSSDVNPANNFAIATLSIAAVPDLTLALSAAGSFSQGGTGTFVLSAANAGGVPTTTAVSVADTLPSGITPVSAAGPGWSCHISGQAVTCDRSDPLSGGDSYGPIVITASIATNDRRLSPITRS